MSLNELKASLDSKLNQVQKIKAQVLDIDQRIAEAKATAGPLTAAAQAKLDVATAAIRVLVSLTISSACGSY